MRTKTSKYFGVCRVKNTQFRSDGKPWQAQLLNYQTGILGFKYFDDEKEAAKWIDTQLINQGKDPVNILKKIS